ncbi:acyltransferase family protein [Sabulicella rubraurantiaca]|uniref:acyltransferase family protein n=1 Tax=Sabulicella rubraurantiaca TaxID=2811429 RepID=UPI001A97424B|nr:acyltransferase [Sabulicella rubraurantiaca]
MSERESLYLDLVRALAALAVLVDHAIDVFHPFGQPRWGHQAVVVFFVLSGYVICHSWDRRPVGVRAFMIARLARLWSVLVPTIVLTLASLVVIQHFGIQPTKPAPTDWPLIRIGANLFFLSETWVSIQLFSNGVMWSLAAELWYYVFFALWVVMPRNPMRHALLVAAVLLAGHKALLLLPIWLMGVAMQRWNAPRHLGNGTSAVLLVGGIALMALLIVSRSYDHAIAFMRAELPPFIVHHLAQARVFWLDWVFGVAVTMHLLGARRLVRFVAIERYASVIRFWAGVSFAAYLFHTPLLKLCAAFLPPDQGPLAIAITLALIALLGHAAEGSKGWWKARLEAAADLLESRPRARAVLDRARGIPA